LDAQGNLRGEICFGTQASAAVAVGSDGNPVVAGSTYFPGAISIAPGQTPISAPQVQYSGDAPGLVKGEIQVNFQIPPQLVSSPSAEAFQFYLQVGTAVSDPFTVYVQ
jgi:hypothetical protein